MDIAEIKTKRSGKIYTFAVVICANYVVLARVLFE